MDRRNSALKGRMGPHEASFLTPPLTLAIKTFLHATPLWINRRVSPLNENMAVSVTPF